MRHRFMVPHRVVLSSMGILSVFLWTTPAVWAAPPELLMAPAGESAGDNFGWGVGSAGDVNGDGFADLLIAARYNDAAGGNAGRAYVYYGGPGADAIPDLVLTGEAANDQFGQAAAGAGDVNGDGFDDVIVGSYGNDTGGNIAGRAYVYYGGPGADAIPDLIFTGEAPIDALGYSLDTAGDVNGDGFDDLIVGAYGSDVGGMDAGRAYVYYGGPGADAAPDLVFTGAVASANFGFSVGAAGDMNGDGFDDVIVGAWLDPTAGPQAGRAFVFYGGSSADTTPDLTLVAEGPGDVLGYSVSTAGDVNGDGFDDAIVGAHGNSAGGAGAGRAYVYYGGPGADAVPDLIFTGEASGDNLGNQVGCAGDVNGDGFDDLTVGAWANDAGGANAGRAYVYYGGPGADAVPDLVFDGAASGDRMGISVGAAGDVNGDGVADVIFGADKNDAAAYDAGRAYVYAGHREVGAFAGTVSADCPALGAPLGGVVVDVYSGLGGAGELIASTETDTTGAYVFDGLSPGDYAVTVVAPLGYSAVQDEVDTVVVVGDTVRVDFPLFCPSSPVRPRGLGFWKHQVKVAIKGKGKSKIGADELCGYLDMIEQHFNNNTLNAVVVYDPPDPADCAVKLSVAGDLLRMKGKKNKHDKARQQLLALLLNVASEKLPLTAVISQDGATVSQALTYCDREIDAVDGLFRRAKQIAKRINGGRTVKAGWIPLDTEFIAYSPSHRERPRLLQNVPNPFYAGTIIVFDLPEEAAKVALDVFDVTGRLVRTLRVEDTRRGFHEVAWDGTDQTGSRISAGVYVYRLSAGSFTATRRMILLR